MFGMTIIRTSELPFYREITALIQKRPEYLDGIRKGIVHIKFLPGHGPEPKAPKKSKVPLPETDKLYAAPNGESFGE